MKPITKKIISIILNIFLAGVFVLYTALSATGALTTQSTNIFSIISSYIFRSMPVIIMIALAFSFSYRNDEKYEKSIIIQIIPFITLIIAQCFTFLSLI
ncbi:MAG: hypothetical protein E7391_00550 [Ruminococcaceae bacterium]|nr:hypothetical protein [Oscillospiraceae bacterium]